MAVSLRAGAHHSGSENTALRLPQKWLCVPKSLSALIRERNRLTAVHHDLAARFRNGRTIQVGERDLVWSKYWSEASIPSIENLVALITVPVPHRRPG
jgi:hypothetical protein